MSEKEPPSELWTTFKGGVAVAFGIPILLVVALLGAGSIGRLVSNSAGSVTMLFLMPIGFIGLTQFIYIGPMIYRAGKQGREGFRNGLLVGAGIIFLLQTACMALVFGSR
jgi:hypothetical protein